MFFQTNPLQPIIVSSADSIIPAAFSPSGVATAFVQILQLLWQGQEFPCTPQDVICGTGGQAPQDGVEQSALGLVRFIRCERSSKIYWNRVTRKKQIEKCLCNIELHSSMTMSGIKLKHIMKSGEQFLKIVLKQSLLTLKHSARVFLCRCRCHAMLKE